MNKKIAAVISIAIMLTLSGCNRINMPSNAINGDDVHNFTDPETPNEDDQPNSVDPVDPVDSVNSNTGTTDRSDITISPEYVPCMFNNYDGSLLYQESYEKGTNVVYHGPTPTKAMSFIYGKLRVYTFKGWDRPTTNIETPTIFTAEYDYVDKSVKVGDVLELGVYPKTVVDNKNLIKALDNLSVGSLSGKFTLYGNDYEKVTAKPARNFYTYANGKTISDSVYYFKYEPLEWNIIDIEEDVLVLMSRYLIDAYRFDSEKNNYKDSDIRSWLNTSFINNTFKLDETYNFKINKVYNSLETTMDEYNDNVDTSSSPYTRDKVYILSRKEFCNPFYGFDVNVGSVASNTGRVATCTDYCKAKGVILCEDVGFEDAAWYWTRSPAPSGGRFSYSVTDHGSASGWASVSSENSGVRPCIKFGHSLMNVEA